MEGGWLCNRAEFCDSRMIGHSEAWRQGFLRELSQEGHEGRFQLIRIAPPPTPEKENTHNPR